MMLLYYIYASVAAGALLTLPSFGAWLQANYVFDHYSHYHGGYGIVRKRTEADYDQPDVDWWNIGLDFARKESYALWSLPSFIGCAILAWPLSLACLLTYNTFKYGSKMLALPGKALVQLSKNKKQQEKFIEEGKREVEKLLSTSH